MLGRYFSSHSGDILASPRAPQRENWNWPPLVEHWQDPLGELVGDAEHVVDAEADARPIRDRTCPAPGRRRARVNWAAAMPIWHSRHITFSPLRMAFFCSFSKGPKSSISPANCLASAATCTAVASGGIDQQRSHAAAAAGKRVPEGFFGASQGADRPNTGDDDSTLRRTHVSSEGCRRRAGRIAIFYRIGRGASGRWISGRRRLPQEASPAPPAGRGRRWTAPSCRWPGPGSGLAWRWNSQTDWPAGPGRRSP